MFQNMFSSILTYMTPPTRYQINDRTLLQEVLISEGGYAYVYRVSDISNTAQKYALKRIRLGVKFDHSF